MRSDSYAVAQREKLTNALSEVFNALNVLGSNNGDLIRDFFRRQHRTLQQQFVKVVILPVLEELAEAHQSGRVDGRNESAARLAHKMLANVKEEDKYLPLI